MLIHRKLISVILMFLVLAVSALALSPCPQMPEMGNVQPQMAMMVMAPVHLSFTTTQTTRCCEIPPAEIAPVTVPASLGADANVIAIALVAAILVSNRDRATGYTEAQAASPPTQARLCVFLI
jgi:hypothetical protein